MKALLVVVGRAKGETQANLHLVTGDDRGDDRPAVRPDHFRGGQRGGDNRRARVNRAARVGIVEVERVPEIAVEQRGGGRRVRGAVADDAGVAGAESEMTQRRRHGGAQPRVVAPANADADLVHEQHPGALDDIGTE